MRAVFRHELSSGFTGLTSYVFSGFVLLFTGIYTMVYNLKNAYPNFEYVLGSMSFVFLIIVPIFTMKTLSGERRQKTDQLLYALPLSMTQVVLGKFFALAVIFLVPVGIMGMYPLILSAFGKVNLLAAYTSLVGFYCLGCCLIALGVFVSALAESQAVAAGMCFVAMLLNYFISDLSGFVSTQPYSSLAAMALVVLAVCLVVHHMTQNALFSLMLVTVLEGGLAAAYIHDSASFEGLFPSLISKLSLFERFYSLVNGVFDLGTLVYYLSIAAVFLFLAVQVMEKRRWSE